MILGGFPQSFGISITAVSHHSTHPPLHLQSAHVVLAQGFVVSTDCKRPCCWGFAVSSLPANVGMASLPPVIPQEFHRVSGLGTQSISWWETEWRLLERPFSFKLIEDIFSGKGTGASPWLGFSLGIYKAKVQVSGLPDSSPASP